MAQQSCSADAQHEAGDSQVLVPKETRSGAALGGDKGLESRHSFAKPVRKGQLVTQRT